MSEEAAPKTKIPKSKKSGPDRATKMATTFKHKVSSLERHLKLHPEDSAAKSALDRLGKKGSVTPRRTPNSERWTRLTKDLAHTHRLCGYRGHGVLRFGQQGVGVFDGKHKYHEEACQRLTSKFMADMQKKREADKEKEKSEKQVREAAHRREVARQKENFGKGKKPGAPKASAKKPSSRPTKPKQS